MRFFTVCLLFIFLSSVNSSLQAQCSGVSESDSVSLVNFHLALNGENWGDTAWLNTAVYLWEGITLTEDSCNVLSINLPSASIVTGTFPSDFNLPFLENINLESDSIYGPLPDFSGCPNLRFINLSDNAFEGSVPGFMLDSLEILRINNNQLTGELIDFQGLPSLEQMYVSGNELTGAFPNFTNMPSLTFLSICENEFDIGYPDLEEGAPLLNVEAMDFSCLNCTQIPAEDSLELRKLYDSMGGTSWLNQTGWVDTIDLPINLWFGLELTRDECFVEGINLQANNLSGKLPNDFALESIETFRVHQNNITGSIPDFAGLPNLEQLDLYSNNLNGVLPDFQTPNLRSIDASFNNITGPIPEFSNAANLEYISMRLNKLNGPLPEFSNVQGLRTLLLDFNQINLGIPDFNLPALEILNLSENLLTENLPDFSNMPSLQVLSLENNLVCGNLPEWSNLTSLSFLSVCPNEYLFGAIPDYTLEAGESDFSCIQIDGTEDCELLSSLSTITVGSFEVFPNPSKGLVNFDLPDFQQATLTAYNLLGQAVLTEEINAPTVNLSGIDTGVYLLEIVLDNQRVLRQSVVIAE